MTITGIGETVLDIVFQDMKPQAAVPGGSTFNAMISLGRTAGRDFPEVGLRMVSQIGDDPVGDFVFSFMEQNRVGTGAMVRVKGQTTVSMAMLDEHRNAKYEFFRDRSLPPFRALALTFGSGDIVLTCDIENLEADIAGSGDIKARVNGKLTYSIFGSGDIGYYGNPIVEGDKVGHAGVRRLGD